MAEPAPEQYTTGQIMDGISVALEARDLEGVVALLHLLAVKDPGSAQLIYDAVMIRARGEFSYQGGESAP